MAWRRPPADATDQLLAEEYHLYKTAPGRDPAPSVSKTISPLSNSDILAQAKAKLTANIATYEEERRALRTIDHRDFLVSKYESWKPWQHKKYKKVNLRDDVEVYYDWLRGEAERRWKAKADLGTRVHGHAYDLSMGRDVNAKDDELPYLAAWGRYVEENQVEFIPTATERVILNPAPLGETDLEYGGRDDLFAIHHAGDFPGLNIEDYKTGGKYPTQVTLQIAAYLNGLGFAVYDDLGNLLDTYEPLPNAKRAVIVYLHPDETYNLWEAPASDSAYHAFLDLRRVLNFGIMMKPYEKEAEAEWKAKNP